MIFIIAALSHFSFALTDCPAHTFHNITSDIGTWRGELHPIYEGAKFVGPDCSEFSNPFTLEKGGVVSFGYVITPDDDFNVAYSITMVHQKRQKSNATFSTSEQLRRRLFIDRACVYVVTAAAPAMPDVHANEWNGAVCRWTVNEGVGENYQVAFRDF